MKKRISTLLSLALVLAFSAQLTHLMPMTKAPEAFADPSDSYTATIRYYDNVQITYTLTYPSSGLWSGSADIPIGSMGGLSSQIYCVDPFVPFHSQADNSYWDNLTSSTVDIKNGYTVAAPWAVSPALRQNYDSVRWITLNGYRGNYLARATDSESQTSLAHLQTLYLNNPAYPDVTILDETIALMATKLAIWKVLAGDNITVLHTSLDNTPARRVSMDALVNALVADAGNRRVTSLTMTTFNLAVEFDSSGYTQVSTVGSEEIFGALRVTAELENALSTLDLDKVFITASGLNAANIVFYTEQGGSFVALPSSPTETIYGTSIEAQYLDAALFATSGGKLVSPEIFIGVPDTRDPANGDQLLIRAYAMANDVALLAGTPVTFVYGDSGSMDWNAVQAFIGAADDGMVIDLYSDAFLNTGETTLGELYITKNVVDASPLDSDQQFTFELLHSTSASGPWTTVSLSQSGSGHAHQVHGAVSVDDSANTFTLRHGDMAVIDHLAADPDDYYILREISIPSGYELVPQFTIPLAMTPITVNTDGAETTPFQFDDELAMVSFYNNRITERAHLYIGKAAMVVHSDGSEFEFDRNTVFEFRLEQSSDNGTTWSAVDLTGIFRSDDGVILSATNGTFGLTSMDRAFIELDPTVGISYRVLEINLGPHYEVGYVYVIYTDDGAGGWLTSAWASILDPDWGSGQDYPTNNIVVGSGQYCLLEFDNINVIMCDLTISKSVVDPTGNADPDQLFSFELICETENLGFPVGISLPLSDGTLDGTLVVEGLSADRIIIGSMGYPAIMQLKDGDTATIIGLPAGSYRVIETSTEGFSTAYSIDLGTLTATTNGQTAPFEIFEDTTVVFVNTLVPSSDPRDGDGNDGDNNANGNTGNTDNNSSGTTRTGDNTFWFMIYAALLACAGGVAVFLAKRKKAKTRKVG